MHSRSFSRHAVALTAAVLLSAAGPAPARADEGAVVLGGGVATFDDVPGLESIFWVAAIALDNGDAGGWFFCAIPDVVEIEGPVHAGSLNDDGSVTLMGIGHGFDYIFDEPFEDCPYTVTLWPGGRGFGRFLYSDCVVPPPGDAETVQRGRIRIRHFDD